MNSDLEDSNFLDKIKITTISYGYGNKSTLTVSSKEQEELILCLQRSIKSVDQKTIEPQEISVKISEQEDNTYILMGIKVLELLYKK